MNHTEKSINGKRCELISNMSELECMCVTVHEIANILKRNYFETIPIEPEDKSDFVNGFYSMNELINVIWDYSDRIRKGFDTITDGVIEIGKDLTKEAANNEETN